MPSPTACWTDPGRRRTNQDAAISALLADNGEVVAVADGMGGHAAGEVASQQALNALVAALRGGADLRAAIRTANRAVYEQAQEASELQGMGTTLVVYLRRGRQYEIANVGDSRAYLIEEGSITQISRDHSFVAEAIASGELTEEEARHSPWRNALTRAIGTDPEVEPDLFGPFDATRPQTILLCTDGFHRWVPEAEVPTRIAAAGEPQVAAATLGQAALRQGSDDNVTVMLIEVGSPSVASAAVAGEVVASEAVRDAQAWPGRLGQVGEAGARQGRHGPAAQIRRTWRRWQRWDLFYFAILLLGLLAYLAALALLVH
jgi:protein phosphatase